MGKQEALERVSALSQKIANGEMSLDQWKWQRAEAMAQASESGATQREIAEVAGISQPAVNRHLKVWLDKGALSDRTSYSEAYDAVTGFDREAAQARVDIAATRRTLTDAPAEVLEGIVQALPAGSRHRIREAVANTGPLVIGGEEAERKRKEKHKEAHSLRWVEANGDLGKMRRLAMGVLTLAREVPFEDEERELLVGDIEQITAVLGLCKLAISGTSGVDWDAELERMTV